MRTEKSFGCGNFSLVGPIKGKPGKFGYKCLFCGSYRCDRCRGPKLRKMRARLAQIASEHKLTKMVTLTLDPKRLSKQDRKRTDRYIRGCWRKMRVLLARKHKGKSLPFVCVLEFQKNGNAHLHVLIGKYIAQKQLSKAWQRIGGGRYVDIRAVDVHRVSAYLSVYLAGDKVLHTLDLLPRRARIFTTSRGIVLWGKKEKSSWWLRRVDVGELYDAAENPTNVRFEPVPDLAPFGLEQLSYFESPPLQEALGNRDVITVLKAAIPVWQAKTS
jgi:hypothetical protein